MHKVAQIHATLFKLASASREVELVKQAAGRMAQFLRDPRVAWGVGATGLGAAGLGIPLAFSAGERVGEEENKLVRNLAFGGGLLSGLVAPSVLKGLGHLVGLTPTAQREY